jgi:hypothetical protein
MSEISKKGAIFFKVKVRKSAAGLYIKYFICSYRLKRCVALLWNAIARIICFTKEALSFYFVEY